MTRKDYRLLGAIFSDHEPHDKTSEAWKEWDYLIKIFSLRLQMSNDRFDRQKFEEDCRG